MKTANENSIDDLLGNKKTKTANENSINDLFEWIMQHQIGLMTDHELLCLCKTLNPIEPEVGYVDPATGLKYPFNVKK